MSKNCLESAGATPSTAELEVLVNEITTGTSTKAASSRNRLRLFSFQKFFPQILSFIRNMLKFFPQILCFIRNMLRQMVLDKMRN